MLVNQKETGEVLRRIVFKLTPDRALREDLTQEALVHLWLREKERPGQTRSWYVQSCRFHLQNYLRNGRSVDSPRRHRFLCVSAETEAFRAVPSDHESVSSRSVLALVSTREILSLLGKWLSPVERGILSCLAEGLGMREIASRLNLSHTSVIRYRRKIASLAVRLGVEPLPGRSRQPHRSGTGGLSEVWRGVASLGAQAPLV